MKLQLNEEREKKNVNGKAANEWMKMKSSGMDGKTGKYHLVQWEKKNPKENTRIDFIILQHGKIFFVSKMVQFQ